MLHAFRSATCIFAELLLKKKLFESQGKAELLTDIFSVLGLPGENFWPVNIFLALLMIQIYFITNHGLCYTNTILFIKLLILQQY